MKNPIGRPFLVSAGWILALALLAYFPILFLGRAYDANDLLAQFTPWRTFFKQSLAQGVLPLWNPHMFCGQPFLADLQNHILYPPFWLTVPFSVPMGLGLFTVIHFLVAAFGMRAFCRTLGLSEDASRVGALLFAFSGFFWWEIIHPPVLAAFAWLPWWFASLEKLAREPNPRNGWGAGFAFAMLFLAGSFQVTMGGIYGGVLYALVRFFKPGATGSDAPRRRPALSQIAVGLSGVLLGASLLSLQMVPTQAYTHLSVRENAGKSYDNFNAYWSLRPDTLHQFLFPRLGVPKEKTIEQAIQEVTPDVGNNFLANFGYLGVWVPFLAAFALFGRRRALAWLLAALMGLTLFLAFGKYFFLHRLLCNLGPGFDLLRAPFRFLYLYVLAATVLASMGYQSLLQEPESEESRRGRRTAVWVYGGFFALVGLSDPAACWRELLALALVTTGVSQVLRAASTPSAKTFGKFLVAAGLVGPLLLSAWGDFASHPVSNLDIPGNAPWRTALQSASTSDRVWLDASLPLNATDGVSSYQVSCPENAGCVLGLKVARGYNPLMLGAYGDVLSGGFPLVAKLAGVRRLALGQDAGEIPGFKKTLASPIFIYEPLIPPPHVYAPRWIVENDPDRRLAMLRSPSFDPFQESILSSRPAAGTSLDKPLPLKYRLVEENPNYQEWKIEAPAACVAIFAEAAYPDWKAFVDGNPETILTANHAFRALSLPAGEHSVVFRFAPAWRPFLVPGVLAWILLSGLWMAFFLRRQISRKP